MHTHHRHIMHDRRIEKDAVEFSIYIKKGRNAVKSQKIFN